MPIRARGIARPFSSTAVMVTVRRGAGCRAAAAEKQCQASRPAQKHRACVQYAKNNRRAKNYRIRGQYSACGFFPPAAKQPRAPAAGGESQEPIASMLVERVQTVPSAAGLRSEGSISVWMQHLRAVTALTARSAAPAAG